MKQVLMKMIMNKFWRKKSVKQAQNRLLDNFSASTSNFYGFPNIRKFALKSKAFAK